MLRVLAAGDGFVLTRLLTTAAHDALPGDVETEFGELDLPWPHEPFGDVGGVTEASGTEDQVIEALAGARVCLTQMAPLTRRVLQACPDLELFAVGRGGPVNADLAAATEHGVRVTSAPGRNAAATAEYTVGMVLAATRRIPASHAELVAGRWEGGLYAYDQVGAELDDATVGLVGSGAVGGRVARALAALGAHVRVFDPYAPADALPDTVTAVGSLEELLDGADVVSLHARLTDETREMIDDAALRRMPAGAVLVNCARGGLVDHAALAQRLRDGHLRAAGLDVFDVEPLPADHPLRSAPNVVMTPHLAGASRGVAHRAAAIVAAELGRWWRGELPAHCANPEVLPTA